MEASALEIGKDAARETRRSARKTRLVRLVSIVVTMAVVALWVVFLRPVSLGGPADYVIVSGHSMEPTFRTDDVVVAFKQATYAVGVVIVYRVPAGEPAAGDRVIHRIVGGSAAAGFIVKGDNKDGIDPWRPKAEDIVGKARLFLPHVGAGLIFLRTPLGIALVAGLTTLLVALAGASAGARAPTKRRA
jgi:signal peptidase